MTALVDFTDMEVGHLTVLGRGPNDKNRARWFCRCELCGKEILVLGYMLSGGKQVSCGCLRKKRGNPTHGLSKTPEYHVWEGMKTRCEDPNDKRYHRYGGRGVRICEQWRNDFAAFLRDMGSRPSSKHSIDRIDNDGDYEPSNCRWATIAEQAENRSTYKNGLTRKTKVELIAMIEELRGKVAESEALIADWRAMRKCLEWYADAEHYRCRMQGEPGRRTLCDPVIMTTYNSKGDDGKLARETLGLES